MNDVLVGITVFCWLGLFLLFLKYIFRLVVEEWMSSFGHYGDGSGDGGHTEFDAEATLSGLSGYCPVNEETTPGVGDESLPDSWGAYRVSITLNMVHRHLPGDFIKRDKEGDLVLMSWENYQMIVNRMKALSDAYNTRE